MSTDINQFHKGRLEALSDGVFAVVMTLLVLDLKPELVATTQSVWQDLQALQHILEIYAVTFALLGAFWTLQNRLLAQLTKASVSYTWYTLMFLFWVTLLPFTFSLTHRGDGMVLYFMDMTLVGFSLLVGWRHACHQGLVEAANHQIHRILSWRVGVVFAGCLLATVLSFFVPAYGWIAVIVVIVAGRLAIRKFLPAK